MEIQIHIRTHSKTYALAYSHSYSVYSFNGMVLHINNSIILHSYSYYGGFGGADHTCIFLGWTWFWFIASNNRSRLIILFKMMPCYAVIINASNNNTNWENLIDINTLYKTHTHTHHNRCEVSVSLLISVLFSQF